jgi:hypothetical protein
MEASMSENIEAKPYTIVFEDYPTYLYALVHGEQYDYDVIASFLRDIANECKTRNFRSVLVEENISATATEEDIARAAADLPDFGFSDIRMAYLDRFSEQKEINEMGEDIAVDHGVDVKLFNDMAAADKWLNSRG